VFGTLPSHYGASRHAIGRRSWWGPIRWGDRYHFAFETDGREYLIPNRDDPSERKTYDVRRYSLVRDYPALSLTFTYRYGFGDEWIHDVTIEISEAAAFRKSFARMLCAHSSP